MIYRNREILLENILHFAKSKSEILREKKYKINSLKYFFYNSNFYWYIIFENLVT